MLSDRRQKLAIIHIAKKELGLNDDIYRALLDSAAGVDSAAKILNDRQYFDVMAAFRAAGYRPRLEATGGYKRPPDPQMAKCYALWCELHRRGAVQNKKWSAMMSWVSGRLGGAQDIMRRDQKRLLIEELKAWIRRIEREGHS